MALAQAPGCALSSGGKSNTWVPLRRALPACRASVGHQQHQLDEELEAMSRKVQTQTVEPPTHLRRSPAPHNDPHVHNGHHMQQHVHMANDPQHYVFKSSSHARPGSGALHPKVPHLDGERDVVAALSRVREVLRERTTAVVTCEESGTALFDLMSLLLLLDEDVRTEDGGCCILFQPVLDVRSKLAALGLSLPQGGLGHHAAAAASPAHVHVGRKTATHPHNGHYNGHHHVHSSHSHSHSRTSSSHNGHGDHSSDHHSVAADAGVPHTHHHLAALITKARCPKLLAQEPGACVLATPARLDSADVGAHLAALAHAHGCTRLKVASSSPSALVAAFRALRATRSLVRAQGMYDILIAPRMGMEPVAGHERDGRDRIAAAQQHYDMGRAAHSTSSSSSSNGSGNGGSGGVQTGGAMLNNIVTAPSLGNGSGTGSGSSAQHAVMYFNIWVRPRET